MSALGVLEVPVQIATAGEAVFSYFTDPARYIEWKTATRSWSRPGLWRRLVTATAVTAFAITVQHFPA